MPEPGRGLRMKTPPRLSRSAREAIDDRAADPELLAPGDHVRMNALGLARHPRYKGREGLIVGMGSPNTFRVQFRELVTVQGIHRSYLERCPNIPVRRELKKRSTA